jgi:hypothetical protein
MYSLQQKMKDIAKNGPTCYRSGDDRKATIRDAVDEELRKELEGGKVITTHDRDGNVQAAFFTKKGVTVERKGNYEFLLKYKDAPKPEEILVGKCIHIGHGPLTNGIVDMLMPNNDVFRIGGNNVLKRVYKKETYEFLQK